MIKFPRLILTAMLVGHMAFTPVYANTTPPSNPPADGATTPEQRQARLADLDRQIREQQARTRGAPAAPSTPSVAQGTTPAPAPVPPNVQVTPGTEPNGQPSATFTDGRSTFQVVTPATTNADIENSKPSRLEQIQKGSLNAIDRLQKNNGQLANLGKATLDLPQNMLFLYGVIGAVTCSVAAINYKSTPEACLSFMARTTDLKSNVQLAGMLLVYQSIGSKFGFNYGDSSTAKAIRWTIAAEQSAYASFKRKGPTESQLSEFISNTDKGKAARKLQMANAYSPTMPLRRQLLSSTLIFPAAAVIATLGTELVFDENMQYLVSSTLRSPEYKCMANLQADRIGCSPVELEQENIQLQEKRDAAFKKLAEKFLSSDALRNMSAMALTYSLIGGVANLGVAAMRATLINEAASASTGKIVLRQFVAKIPLVRTGALNLIKWNVPVTIALYFATSSYVVEPVMGYVQNVNAKGGLIESQGNYLKAFSTALGVREDLIRPLIFPNNSGMEEWSTEQQTAKLREDLNSIEAMDWRSRATAHLFSDESTMVALKDATRAMNMALATRRQVGAKKYYSALGQWQKHASELINGLDMMAATYPQMLSALGKMKTGLKVDFRRDTSLMRVVSLSIMDPESALLLSTEEREVLADVAHSGLGKLNGIHPDILNSAAFHLIELRSLGKLYLYDGFLNFLKKQASFLKGRLFADPSGPGRHKLAAQATWETIEYLVQGTGNDELKASTKAIGNIVRKANYPDAAIREFIGESRPFFPEEWLDNGVLNPMDLYGSGWSADHKGFKINTKTEGLILEMLCGAKTSDENSRITSDGGIMSRPQFNLPRVVNGNHGGPYGCTDIKGSNSHFITAGVRLNGEVNSPFAAIQKNLIPGLSKERLDAELQKGPMAVEVQFGQWYKSVIEPKINKELDTMFVRHLRSLFKEAWLDKSTDSFSRPSNTPGLIAWKTGQYTPPSANEMYLTSRVTPNGLRASFSEQIETSVRSLAIYAYRMGFFKPGSPESKKFQSLLVRTFQYQIMTSDDVGRATDDIKVYLAEKSAMSESEKAHIENRCAFMEGDPEACVRDEMAKSANNSNFDFVLKQNPATRIGTIQALLQRELKDYVDSNSTQNRPLKSATDSLIGLAGSLVNFFGRESKPAPAPIEAMATEKVSKKDVPSVILRQGIDLVIAENIVVNQVINSKALDFANLASKLN